MTVMLWVDARVTLIKDTDNGWNRHSCRSVWLVACVDTWSEDAMYGNLIYAAPEGQSNWHDLEDPILVFDNGREARMVAEHKGEPWRTLNLSDLLRWEGEGTCEPRYVGSVAILNELHAARVETARRERRQARRKR